MEKYHIGLSQQGIEIYIFGNGFSRIIGIQIIGQNLHAQGLGNTACGLADATEANDSGGLAIQLNKRIVPVAPVDMILPLAFLYCLAVMANMVADFQ